LNVLSNLCRIVLRTGEKYEGWSVSCPFDLSWNREDRSISNNHYGDEVLEILVLENSILMCGGIYEK